MEAINPLSKASMEGINSAKENLRSQKLCLEQPTKRLLKVEKKGKQVK
jgi:hypothetical protein